MKKLLALAAVLVLAGWGCSSQSTVNTTNSPVEASPQTTTTETQDKASVYLDQSQEGITALEELGVK